MSGVKNAYRAYTNWVTNNGDELYNVRMTPALTNEQFFFVYLAQTWYVKQKPTFISF